ncbi:MAG: hypothetical protein NTX52_06330 [Planctomycetota bacterium]|nr:hypothetical protein [Planctomycetota bacterium]
MPVDFSVLIKNIKDGPHWRVNFRPSSHKIRFDNLNKLVDLVRQSSVMLRGWPFPYLSDDPLEQILEKDFVASGSNWDEFREYWRLYCSGQFIDLFAVREKANQKWDSELCEEAKRSILPFARKYNRDIPGFIDIGNTLYHFTEIFEFASRLFSKGLYDEACQITIELNKVSGFALIATFPRFWHGYYPATSDHISKSWTVSPQKILTVSTDLALEGAVYVFQQFGWDNPPVDGLKEEQQKFLSGKV